jgi:hypothetical protein
MESTEVAISSTVLGQQWFRLEECSIASRGLFDHALAQARYGASIFWIRPGLLIDEGVEGFTHTGNSNEMAQSVELWR